MVCPKQARKVEWLITNITAVGSPAGAETVSWGDFGCFLANSGSFCAQRAMLRPGNPSPSVKTLTQDHSMKIEWLITNVSPVGSPRQIKSKIILGDFGCFSTNSGQYCGPGVFL